MVMVSDWYAGFLTGDVFAFVVMTLVVTLVWCAEERRNRRRRRWTCMFDIIDVAAIVLAAVLASGIGYAYAGSRRKAVEQTVEAAARWLKANPAVAKGVLGEDLYADAMRLLDQVDAAMADGKVTVTETIAIVAKAYPVMAEVLKKASAG